MIHLTDWESPDNSCWQIKVEYAYYPKIQEVVILDVYRYEPVKHIDDLQWVEFDQHDNDDFIRWENECAARQLGDDV